MSVRSRVAMSAPETADMLAGSRKIQLATINPDGTPHLVAMYYVLRAGRITFWTYRASQKAHNLARDPRLTCLVEQGEGYFDLRGVQVRGVAEPIDDPAEVVEVGRLITGSLTAGPPTAGPPTGGPGEALDAYVTHTARKRVAYAVDPVRIVSWDHRKLLT
jgi:PPOX class probable F420-dependent enzyme